MHLFEMSNNNSTTMSMDVAIISLLLSLNKYLPMRSNNGVNMTIDKPFIRKLCISVLTLCSSFNVDLQLNISLKNIHLASFGTTWNMFIRKIRMR